MKKDIVQTIEEGVNKYKKLYKKEPTVVCLGEKFFNLLMRWQEARGVSESGLKTCGLKIKCKGDLDSFELDDSAKPLSRSEKEKPVYYKHAENVPSAQATAGGWEIPSGHSWGNIVIDSSHFVQNPVPGHAGTQDQPVPATGNEPPQYHHVVENPWANYLGQNAVAGHVEAQGQAAPAPGNELPQYPYPTTVLGEVQPLQSIPEEDEGEIT